jgi:hypothetical protein
MPAIGGSSGTVNSQGDNPSSPLSMSNNAYGQYQAFQGMFGPGLAMSQAGYQQQQDALQNQLATYGASTGYQQGLVGQDLQNQLAQYGLQGQGLQQQQAYQQGQYGLQQQGFGLQQQNIDYLKQLYPQEYAIQQQQFGLSEQGLSDQLKQAQVTYGQNVHGAQSDATARGSINSAGFGGPQGTLANLSQQLGYTERGIGRQQQGLGLSEQQAKLAYGQQQFGLGQQQSQLGLSEQGAALTNTYQGQQIQNALKGLGLSEQQARTKADQAIAQLGLQGQISSDQILQQLGGLQSGQASNLMGVLPQIISLMQGAGTGTGG